MTNNIKQNELIIPFSSLTDEKEKEIIASFREALSKYFGREIDENDIKWSSQDMGNDMWKIDYHYHHEISGNRVSDIVFHYPNRYWRAEEWISVCNGWKTKIHRGRW